MTSAQLQKYRELRKVKFQCEYREIGFIYHTPANQALRIAKQGAFPICEERKKS